MNALPERGRYTLALRICHDLALTFVPDDPYEIVTVVSSIANTIFSQIAATDYRAIDQCPDDPASELLKSQVNVMTEKTVVVH